MKKSFLHTLLLTLAILVCAESIVHAESLGISRTQVEVSYKQKGHIFAFIPITFTVRAVASADGRVEMEYPWYSVITIDNRREVETELKIAVETTLSASKVGSVRAEGKPAQPQFTPSESAQVVSAMHSVLQAKFEKQVK